MRRLLFALCLLLACVSTQPAGAVGNLINAPSGVAAKDDGGSFLATRDWTVGGATWNLACLGDSITANVGTATVNYCQALSAQIASARSVTLTLTYVGLVGYSWNYTYPQGPYQGSAVNTLNAIAPYWIDPQRRPSLRNVLVLFAGSNGLWSTLGNHTAAAEYADFVSNVTARLAAGWKPSEIYVVTTLPRQDDASFDTKRAAYNALVIAGASTYGYTVVDAGADATIGCNGCEDNTTNYQTDKIHLNNTGQSYLTTTLIYPLLPAGGAANDNEPSPGVWYARAA